MLRVHARQGAMVSRYRGDPQHVADLNWQAYQERVSTSTLVVLPVGGMEAHGAHLPLNTDTLIVEHLARALAEQADALLLPTIHYGVRANPIRLGGEFPGNIDVDASAFTDYLLGVLTSVYHDGVRDIVVLFTTYSNGPFVHEAMKRFVEIAPDARIMAASWWNLVSEETRNAIAAETGVARSDDNHSGMVETSLIMHAAPDAVRPELIDDESSARRASYVILPMPDDLATRTGIVFRARMATAEIGKRVLEEVQDNLLKAVRTEFQPNP